MSTQTWRDTIAKGSRSFALASLLLPPGVRDDVAILYSWCRHCDDAIDRAPAATRAGALAALRRGLDEVYSPAAPADPLLAALHDVFRRHGVPRAYPEALLDGMEMDVVGTRYVSVDGLLLYCHRVAGVVGLMMCHLLGVSDARALRSAAHLGMAMQLTNICRDVVEDWENHRLYVPRELLAPGSRMRDAVPGSALHPSAGVELAPAVASLLASAERFYRSADDGIPSLPFRAGLAVRAARMIYSHIGDLLARRGHDVTQGRVVVPAFQKIGLLVRAVVTGIMRGGPARFVRAPLPEPLQFPRDILTP